MKASAAPVLLIAAALTLTGCSSPGTPAGGSGSPSPVNGQGVLGVPPDGDRLMALQGVTTAVLGVAETEPGRWEITTRLVDPPGSDGGPVAQLGVMVCEEAVQRGATAVSVLGADGVPFVVYDEPVYGATCTEV